MKIIIENLFWKQQVELKLNDITVKNLSINRGVRQGCILSPLPFNIFSEEIFKESLNLLDKGIKVNGVPVRYADDTTILAESIEDLQLMENRVNE